MEKSRRVLCHHDVDFVGNLNLLPNPSPCILNNLLRKFFSAKGLRFIETRFIMYYMNWSTKS